MKDFDIFYYLELHQFQVLYISDFIIDLLNIFSTNYDLNPNHYVTADFHQILHYKILDFLTIDTYVYVS